jgi:MFS family permease
MTDLKKQNNILLAAIVAIACCEIALGFMTQVIPLVMEADGLSARLIGLNTSIGQLGVFVCGMALPLVTRRVDAKAVVLASVILLIVTLLLFAVTKPLYAWYVIRFANGFGISALFTISETWITVAAGAARRARVLGLYTSVMTVTFGLAPFVVAKIGFASAWPWLIGAACLVLGLGAVFAVKVDAADHQDTSSGFISVLRQAPAIYACVLVTTTFEAISLTFFTIYGMRNGLSTATAVEVLGIGIIGCLFFFYPVGQLADHWSRGKTATLCAVIATTFAVLTAFTINSPFIWPITIILRAGAFGVYIVAMSSIGDSFKGNELVTASALVSMAWGVGGMLGAPLAGAVIDTFGINTLPWMMAGCYASALLALSLNRWTLLPRHSS